VIRSRHQIRSSHQLRRSSHQLRRNSHQLRSSNHQLGRMRVAVVVMVMVVCAAQAGAAEGQGVEPEGRQLFLSDRATARQYDEGETGPPSSRFSIIPAFIRRMFSSGSQTGDEIEKRSDEIGVGLSRWRNGAPSRQFRRPASNSGRGTRKRLRTNKPRSSTVKMSQLPTIVPRSPNGIRSPSSKNSLRGGPLALTGPPLSLDGWVSFPTQSPKVTLPEKRRPVRSNKPGQCLSPAQYGIGCNERMDQCERDDGCPGVTRCCEVAECGRMCVRGAGPTAAPRLTPGGASSVLKRQQEEAGKKAKKTASGLKISDIAPTASA